MQSTLARAFSDKIQYIRYERVYFFYEDTNVDTELQAPQGRFGILAEVSGV